MGELKNSKKSNKEYSLSKFEVNYLKALVINRNESYNAYQRAIQAFLIYLADGKWAIKDTENYEFTADLEKGTVNASQKSVQ